MYESFATVWERVADAIPDAPAVVQGERRVSYRDVEDRAARLATALADLGVGRDDHVALFLHNCPEYMECLFALSKDLRPENDGVEASCGVVLSNTETTLVPSASKAPLITRSGFPSALMSGVRMTAVGVPAS